MSDMRENGNIKISFPTGFGLRMRIGDKVVWNGFPDDKEQLVIIVDIREHKGHNKDIYQIKLKSGLVLMTTYKQLRMIRNRTEARERWGL